MKISMIIIRISFIVYALSYCVFITGLLRHYVYILSFQLLNYYPNNIGIISNPFWLDLTCNIFT